MDIIVEEITPTIGAEVQGIDLSQPLNDRQVETLRSLFLKHLVLVFRNQTLTRDQHKTFARSFGNIHIHPSKRNGLNKEDPEVFIINIKPDAKLANGET
ncbi:MAG: TauD/TfdA family dioxygenase, partial [Pseudomonadota bacterium]